MDKCKNCGEPIVQVSDWIWNHANKRTDDKVCWDARPSDEELEKYILFHNSPEQVLFRTFRNKIHNSTRPRPMPYEKKLTLDQLERIWAICQEGEEK